MKRCLAQIVLVGDGPESWPSFVEWTIVEALAGRMGVPVGDRGRP